MTTATVGRKRARERPEIVARRKRRLREAGVSYHQLAKYVGVSYSMVDKWVNGERISKPIETAYEALTRAA